MKQTILGLLAILVGTVHAARLGGLSNDSEVTTPEELNTATNAVQSSMAKRIDATVGIAVEQITEELSNITNTIAKKADADSVTIQINTATNDLQTKVTTQINTATNALQTKVTTQINTAVSPLATKTALNAKADSSTVSGIAYRVTSLETPKTRAMFIIPMTGNDGTVYPHFELKATCDNFFNVEYYCMSSLNNDSSYTSGSEFFCDWAEIRTTGGDEPWIFQSGWSGTNIQEFDPRRYYYVDNTLQVRDSVYDTWNNGVIYNGEMRIYEYKENSAAEYDSDYTGISNNNGYFIPRSDIKDNYEKHLPRYYIVFVDPSKCRRSKGSWLRNNNKDLTWRFIRYGDNGLERSYTSIPYTTIPATVSCYYDSNNTITNVVIETSKKVKFNPRGDEFQSWNPIEPIRWL